jgi:GNAT superfamily N-acetyltransferase
MGPPTSEQAGQGVQWPNVDGSVLVFVAERLRSCGLSVTILPEDFEEEEERASDPSDGCSIDGSRKRQKPETKTMRERELAFFRSDRYINEAVKACDGDNRLVAAFVNLSLDKPWLCLTILNNEMSDQIYEALRSDFEVATFHHAIEDVPIDTSRVDLNLSGASFRLEAVTGDERQSETKENVSTRFSLYFQQMEGNHLREKLEAQALCSYCNVEMNTVGPTLELIETAKKWQKRGIGKALIYAIQSFYRNKFSQFQSPVLFNVCHVINYNAGRWLVRKHHFRSFGEDLAKVLNRYQFVDEDGECDEEDNSDNEGDY